MDRSLVLFLIAVVVSLAGGALTMSEAADKKGQPIPFNHSVHTQKTTCWECHFLCEKNRDEDGEIDCEACDEAPGPFCAEHIACPDHKLPGYPQVADCLRCHVDDLLDLQGAEPDAQEPIAQKRKRILFEYVEFDEYDEPQILGSIPWKRVTAITASCIYFSHRTHALVGGIDCATCHGDVGSSSAPPGFPAIEMGMDWCLSCHQSRGVTEECVSCHR